MQEKTWYYEKWVGRHASFPPSRYVNSFLKLWCLVTSVGSDILVSSIRFWKGNIGWSQKPLTEKVLKLIMIFHNSTQKELFSKHQIKLNSRTWMTLKSSVVIFQALEPLQPHWPHQPLQPCWPHQPLQPYFIKKLPGHDDLIISGTKMTNTGSFLWNR